MTGSSRCRWAAAATSGTTPPKRACRSVCEATTLARTRRRVGEDGGGGFIAGGFDAQEQHTG